ncbi:hypothetical protein [Klebsiella quasivariicola]|uniref:hypothetical protein n=1 Tax=Klebsiella quasivariicola TaxID=2026240 RepID=UPI000E3C0A3C|nr:hypothetical protein [Klebsiella quasivariicola]
MFKDYFSRMTTDQERRALAVQAALEVAKASVSAPSAYTGIKTQVDLQNVAAEISDLADAIQEALEGEEEE